MKNKYFFTSLMIFIFAVAISFAASSRQVINFQGYLTDKNGQPVFGTRYMDFSVCTMNNGAAIFNLPARSVTIYNGNYSTELNVTDDQWAQLESETNGQIWLQVRVGQDSSHLISMSPYIQMVAVPFAANVRGIAMNGNNEISAVTINTNGCVTNNGTIRGGKITGAQIIGGTISGVTLSGTCDISSIIPHGLIVMWAGSIASIPAGWALCDGTNGTLDLRDKFIVGAGLGYAPGATGGQDSVTLTSAQIPAHSHTATAGSALGVHSHTYNDYYFIGVTQTWLSGDPGGGNYGYNTASTQTTTAVDLSHTHTITVGNIGGGLPFDNRPAYYALAYIMKL